MADPRTLFDAVIVHLQPFEDLLLASALASFRLHAAFALMPPMGERFITGYVRLAVVAMLALYAGFGMPLATLHELGVGGLCLHAFKETMIGLLLGFAGAKVFWTAESVGALIDMQAGFNSVQLKDPLSGQQSTPVSSLLLHVVVVVFFALGGMLVFLGAVFDSFHVWPMGEALPSWGNLTDQFVLRQTDSLMTGIVKFALPMLLVLALIDIGFGLVTRSAGKLELSSLGQPIKGAVTVLMLALLMSTLVAQIRPLLIPRDLLKQVPSAGAAR